MEKKRIYYLDIAKGIGVFLMILGHVPDLSIPARQFITSFHMPLFFILSGMIIRATGEETREMGAVVRRKLRSIAVPYAVFSVLSLCVELFCISVLKIGEWSIFSEHLFATVCLCGASVFWFLPALFFGELIFLGVRKKTSGAACGIAVVFMLAAAYAGLLGVNYLQATCDNTVAYSYLFLFARAVLRVFFGAAFVAAGYLGYGLVEKFLREKNGEEVRKTGKLLQGLVLGIALMAVTLFVSLRNGITDMNYMVYNNILLYLVTSLCGSGAIILFSSALESFFKTVPLRICMYYGRNSLVVMMTHTPFYIMYVAARVTYGINHHIFPLGQVLLCLCMVIGVLIIEIPVVELLNRYLPFLLGRRRSAKIYDVNRK